MVKKLVEGLAVHLLLACNCLLLCSASFLWGNDRDEAAALEVADNSRHQYEPAAPAEYGVDVSFPIQNARVSENYPWLEHNTDLSKPIPKEHHGRPIQPLGNRQQFYEDFMQGCRDYYGKNGKSCDITEADRVAMSLRQPQSMVVCLLILIVFVGPSTILFYVVKTLLIFLPIANCHTFLD